MPWTSSLLAAMLIAQSAQLQSRLSAKAAVREKRKLEPKLPTGASDVKALPRRRDFVDAADPDSAWAQAVDKFGLLVGEKHQTCITIFDNERDLIVAKSPGNGGVICSGIVTGPRKLMKYWNIFYQQGKVVAALNALGSQEMSCFVCERIQFTISEGYAKRWINDRRSLRVGQRPTARMLLPFFLHMLTVAFWKSYRYSKVAYYYHVEQLTNGLDKSLRHVRPGRR